MLRIALMLIFLLPLGCNKGAHNPPRGEATMNIDRFWQIVEASRKKANGDPDAQLKALRESLEALPPEGVAAYREHFDACDARPSAVGPHTGRLYAAAASRVTNAGWRM